ncbi:MAG: iron export ABC transporter permease subunit FetB [Planctomycetia bacterium]|nr:iron export ABC transporter permease subunit FetB [Planctomycetia bacterium]
MTVDGYIELKAWQVAIAASLVLLNAAISLGLQLGLGRSLVVASMRMVVQLLLIGYVLRWVFQSDSVLTVLALAVIMTIIAGVAAVRRTERRYPGVYWASSVSVLVSSWLVTSFGIAAVLQKADTWYEPQYAIPILGMILGNTLNGISLGLNRLEDELVVHRNLVEMSLTLGATSWEAARGPVRQAVRTGMIPMINSMMVTGIVSLPGMMTGQLLSGVSPLQAVKYQIVIMFLIASGTALGTVGVVLLSFRRLFNRNHQFQSGLLTAAGHK